MIPASLNMNKTMIIIAVEKAITLSLSFSQTPCFLTLDENCPSFNPLSTNDNKKEKNDVVAKKPKRPKKLRKPKISSIQREKEKTPNMLSSKK